MPVAISGRTIGLIGAVVGAVWLASRLRDLLLAIFCALLLAVAVDRPVGWLQRRDVPRPIGLVAIFGLLVALLAVLLASLVPFVNGELLALREELPGYAVRLERFARRLAPATDPGAQFSFDAVATQLSGHVDAVVGRLTSVTLAAGRAFVLVFATIVLSFFLAVDPTIGPRLLARFAPVSAQERVVAVAAAAHRRIGAWAWGQAVVALTFGAAMGIGLAILGVPYAATLGMVAAVLEVLPYVGGAVTVVLASLAALTVGLPQVLGVMALYVVLVNLEAHVLAPVFVGRLVGLPSVALLIALLVGVELLGVVGALLAVPTAIVLWAIVDELRPAPAVVQRERGMGAEVPAAGEESGAVDDAVAGEVAPPGVVVGVHRGRTEQINRAPTGGGSHG